MKIEFFLNNNLQKIEVENYENELKILHDNTIDASTKQEKLAAERARFKAAIKKLKPRKPRCVRAFFSWQLRNYGTKPIRM